MRAYSKRSINLLTFIIVALLFSQINFLIMMTMNSNKQQNATVEVKLSKLEEQIENRGQEANPIWKLEIPKINLLADIKEGTTAEVLNSYIGHFKETALEDGNIGLAAHNEGYKENYFKDIEKLKIGDTMTYQKGGIKREYRVVENTIIDETNWTYLRNTRDNRVTLITCVSDNPEKRRCVQAVQI